MRTQKPTDLELQETLAFVLYAAHREDLKGKSQGIVLPAEEGWRASPDTRKEFRLRAGDLLDQLGTQFKVALKSTSSAATRKALHAVMEVPSHLAYDIGEEA